MMKELYFGSTVAFWCAAAALWSASVWLPGPEAPRAQSGERRFTVDDVATHSLVDSCWMAIDGVVYDLSEYLPQHPTAPEVITAFCGRDATVAYMTKNDSRPHSSFADGLLKKYRIGTISE